MSATKCEEKTPEARQLKKNVRLMNIGAASYLDGAGFNFTELAQSQFSGVLFETNNFFNRTVYPTSNEVTINDQKYFQLSGMAADRVKQYFPQLKSSEVTFTRESACLISRPQHFLAAKINALEAYSGNKFVLGFNNAGPQIPIEGSYEINKSRMDASFHAFDPWTQQVTSSVPVEEFKKDVSFKLGIPLGGIFHFGFEHYKSTGFAELTLNTLRSGVKQLADKLLGTPGEDWQSRVVLSRDNYVVILGGGELGIKKGDKFKIFNQTHNWTGEPCGESSILVGSIVVSDQEDPWIVEVVGDDNKMFTKAKVLNPKENDSIDTGALVKVHELIQPVAPAAQK